MLKNKNFNLSLQLIILIVVSLYNSIKSQNSYNCPEGFKAIDEMYCPTIVSCPEGLTRVNLYTCAYDNKFATPSKCKTGLECWNGICVDSEDERLTLCPSYTDLFFVMMAHVVHKNLIVKVLQKKLLVVIKK